MRFLTLNSRKITSAISEHLSSIFCKPATVWLNNSMSSAYSCREVGSIVWWDEWSDRHGWHTVITELSRFTHGCMPRLRYVGTRFRRGYARCTIHGGLTDIYEYSRWLCEYSRFLHGFRGSTTVITLSTVLIRCVDGSGTAERRGNLRFEQPYRTAAVVVHFNAAFLLSFVDNSWN